MDVVHNRIPLPRIALLLLTAVLLLAAPRNALALTLSLDNSSIALVGTTAQTVNVTSSDGTTVIAYSVSVQYPPGQPAWLSIGGATGTTPGAVSLQWGLLSCTACTSASATVTLTATAPASVAGTTAIIAVTWTGNGGSTGGSSTITASSTSVAWNNSGGAVTSTTVTLSTTSSTTVAFSLASNTPATWLTVSPSAYSVVSGTPATLTLQFTSTNLAAGTYSANIYVSYGSSQSLSIAVTYTVGASSVLSTTPTSASWGYTSGGSVPYTDVTLNTSAPYFGAVSNASWILLTWPTAPSYFTPLPSVSNFAVSNGLRLIYNTAASVPAAGTQGTVTITDSYGNVAVFAVTFTGGTSTSGTVSVTPTSVTLTAAANSGCCVQTTIQVSSTLGGTLSVALTNPLSLYVSAVTSTNTIVAGSNLGVVIYGNASGLSSISYSGTLTATVTAGSGATYQASIPVSFVVGSGTTTSNGGVLVAPPSLSFSADVNHAGVFVPQYLSVTDTGNYTVTVSGGSSWLSVGSSSGTSGGPASPALIQVTANASGLAAGTYTGTISVVSPSGTTQVSVTLQVYSSAIVSASTVSGGAGGAGSMNFTEIAGQIVGTVPTLYVNASDSSVMNVQASTTTTWLTLPSTAGTTPNAGFSVFFSAANLANGVYTGTINFTSSTAANTLTVPVVLSVTGSLVSSGMTLSPSSISFGTTVSGSSQTSSLNVQASSATSFSASSNASWLFVTPTSGTASTSATYLTVTANPYGLSAGQYTGTITVVGGGTTATATVTFVVSTTGTSGGNVTSSSSSLIFNYQVNGSTPSSQTLTISNAVSGTAGISFTVATTVNGGTTNWLSATVNGLASGQTQANVLVSVNPSSLPAATYIGNITITPSGGNVLTIPVTLYVQGVSTVSATPSNLPFSYQAGGTVPPSEAVTVSGSAAGLSYSVAVSTTSGGNWLSVSKTGATMSGTSDVLSVSVSPASLGAGAYQGTILVQGTGTASGSSTISVVLTVTAPFPSITSVLNAASSLNGPISPGEIVSIKGTALGPATPLGTTLDSTGKVATTLGSVQVLFSGYAAPLTYVSATQINCVVPYEVAPLSSPYVEVKYLNQTSQTLTLRAAATAPGIFTANSTGTGPGAILNFDNSYNSANRPAAAGSTIQLYLTGEGQLSPAGVTGSVTCSAGCATVNQIPLPLLAVAALVNNQPATIAYLGELSGAVSGVLQVNVTIPPNAPSGSVPIVITVGSNSSQSLVTVSVQ